VKSPGRGAGRTGGTFFQNAGQGSAAAGAQAGAGAGAIIVGPLYPP
jgi:hypothetical protein